MLTYFLLLCRVTSSACRPLVVINEMFPYIMQSPFKGAVVPNHPDNLMKPPVGLNHTNTMAYTYIMTE